MVIDLSKQLINLCTRWMKDVLLSGQNKHLNAIIIAFKRLDQFFLWVGSPRHFHLSVLITPWCHMGCRELLESRIKNQSVKRKEKGVWGQYCGLQPKRFTKCPISKKHQCWCLLTDIKSERWTTSLQIQITITYFFLVT